MSLVPYKAPKNKNNNNNQSRNSKRIMSVKSNSNTPMNKDRIVSNTASGAGFLKCAFAAPDFASDNNAGIPDTYSGKTIVKSHRLSGTLTMTTATDTYILILPTPGYAFWKAEVAAGTPPTQTTVWSGTRFSDTNSVFPSALSSTNFTQFRMVSNIFELKCTSNATQWSGSITAWKFPTTFNVIGQTTLSANQTNLYQVNGLQNASVPPGMCYTTTQNMGIYTPCYHLTEEFIFKPVLNNCYVNRTDSDSYGYLDQEIFGFDNDMEGMCIRIQASNTSFITKNWQCVEYQVNMSSALYDYARISASKDEKALRIYHEFTKNSPIAFTSFENDTMWERILRMFMSATAAASFMPGPYGAVAGGLNAVGSGLQAILL